ncbi:MAG: ferrous iron transport protein A [Ignavibacteriales bacterium CG12_big_fil_rev_8_21_14_0_65_30_8]|nr:MAG: ferrous iron transport protein A [Ignavibacteriales bacterium CG12_big_fil_rev_8_21_14_0_65_30_8]
MKTAADLKHGEKVIINCVNSKHPSAKRLLEVGFTPGQEIELVNRSTFNDPIAISIRGTVIALRRSDADCIIIA